MNRREFLGAAAVGMAIPAVAVAQQEQDRALQPIVALKADSASVNPGAGVTVEWQTDTPDQRDWIAVYRAGEPDKSENYLKYDNFPEGFIYTKGEAKGSVRILMPEEEGNYEIRFLLRNEYIVGARIPVSVSSNVPKPPNPDRPRIWEYKLIWQDEQGNTQFTVHYTTQPDQDVLNALGSCFTHDMVGKPSRIEVRECVVTIPPPDSPPAAVIDIQHFSAIYDRQIPR